MRLIMIGRAVLPPPAMAPSTHLLPVASKALANSATAAASPPDVHQWVTSRSVAEAGARESTKRLRAASAAVDKSDNASHSSLNLKRYRFSAMGFIRTAQP